jgi:hypothetical protein
MRERAVRRFSILFLRELNMTFLMSLQLTINATAQELAQKEPLLALEKRKPYQFLMSKKLRGKRS